MTIWLDCVPSTTTAQGKRANFNTGHFYTEEKELSWTQFLTGMLTPYAPSQPMEGFVSLRIIFVWPLTKGDESTRAKREALDHCPVIYHNQKPDWDNAPKSLVDVMGKLGFFKDDKQIVEAEVVKLRGRETGILIEIGEYHASPHTWHKVLTELKGESA